jgi:tyrosyl-tRNA synthetase
MDEIARLERLDGVEINEAKKILASEATALLHGRSAAEESAETARRTFEDHGAGDALPTVVVDRAILAEGLGLLSAFVQAGLAVSNGEVRRQVKGGGVRVNDQVVTDDRRALGERDLNEDGVIKLSLGRKRHALLKAG